MNIIKKIIRVIKHPKGELFYPDTWNNELLIDKIRSMGGMIGKNTRFISPAACNIDFGRASYIKIGDNCCLTFVNILAHDYSWYTLLESCGDILPDAGGYVTIGNNVFVGYDALILKDTTIGDNCIIGARSVVKGNIPANTVWAGVPAKQICTLDEFYKKRESKRIDEARRRVNHFRNLQHREPTVQEMGMFGFLFLERTEQNYSKYIKDIEFNGVKDTPIVKNHFFKTKPTYCSFEEFLKNI